MKVKCCGFNRRGRKSGMGNIFFVFFQVNRRKNVKQIKKINFVTCT